MKGSTNESASLCDELARIKRDLRDGAVLARFTSTCRYCGRRIRAARHLICRLPLANGNVTPFIHRLCAEQIVVRRFLASDETLGR